MDFKPVLLFLLVAVATSLAKKPCCFPDQYEMTLGTTIGFATSKTMFAFNTFSQRASDFTNKKVGMNTTTYKGGRTITTRTIWLYKLNVQYVIDEEQRKCDKLKLPPGGMQNCVNPKATFYRSVYLGDNQLTVDNYGYDSNQGRINMSVMPQEQDCLQISSSLHGRIGGMSVLRFTEYSNYVKGIKDPAKFFTVPDYCRASFAKKPSVYDSVVHNLPFF